MMKLLYYIGSIIKDILFLVSRTVLIILTLMVMTLLLGCYLYVMIYTTITAYKYLGRPISVIVGVSWAHITFTILFDEYKLNPFNNIAKYFKDKWTELK